MRPSGGFSPRFPYVSKFIIAYRVVNVKLVKLKYIFEILEFVEFLYIHKTQIYKVKMKINTQRIQMPTQNILREIDYYGNNKTDQIFSLADNNVIF